VIIALSMDECACSLQYTVIGGRPASPCSRTVPPARCRAAAMASMLELEAVSLMCPWNAGGSASSWRSQSHTVCSSSVGAGPLRHSMALTLSAAVSVSPRMPGPEPEMAK